MKLSKYICKKCVKKNWNDTYETNWQNNIILCEYNQCPYRLEHIISKKIKDINRYIPNNYGYATGGIKYK